MTELELNAKQKKLIGMALAILSVATMLMAAKWLLGTIATFLSTFAPVLVPLATGAILALVLKPYYDWVHKQVRGVRVLALTVVFLTLLIPIAAFLLFFGNILLDQIRELLKTIPSLLNRLETLIVAYWPNIKNTLSDQQASLMPVIKRTLMSAWTAGSSAFALVGGLMGWFVLPVYLAFFLMAPPAHVADLDKLLPFFSERIRSDIVFLAEQFVDILVSFFRGQLIIALLQGLLLAAGFTMIDLRFGFILGLLLGILNIIPYLGSIVGLSVCLPLALLQPGGGWVTMVLVLVVFGIVQLIESYLLTPKIMGNRTGLHPLAIIIAVFFWGIALNGILGMLLAIPLTAFLVVFWRLAKQKYISAWIQ